MRFGFDFSLDDVAYEVYVSQGGEVGFLARSRNPEAFGLDETDNWDMPEFYFSQSTHGHCTHPVQVFRRVAAGLAPWARKVQPLFLFFRCHDTRKFSVYERLLNRSGMNALYDIQQAEGHVYLSLREGLVLH